ncbi:tail fiber domain-containing protein [Spirosoma pulveris]
MKNRYHLIASLLTLATVSAQAQVKIGSNPTSLTTTANLQVEATDGSQVVINKTTGNVGIGTVAPGAKLHVLNGNVIFNPTGTNPLNFNSGNTATNPRLSVPRGAIEFQSGETSGGTPIFNFFSNVGGEAMNRLTVLQNGNVGIGTTIPAEKLHINGNVLSLGNFYSFSNEYGIGTKPKTTNVFGLNQGGIEFETAAGTSMKVALDGNVGIGTTTPSSKLHVLTTGTTKAASFLNNDGAGTSTNLWVGGGNPNWGEIKYSNINNINDSRLSLGSTDNEYITVDLAGASVGNVGIGTTAPNAKLHVVGERLYMDCTAADPYGAITINVPNTNSNGALDISEMILFTVAGSAIGNIAPTAAGTGISFNTNSDRRLKENIVTSHYGIKDLMKINVVDYNFKSNKNKMQETGFVAQDLYKVYPIAVTPGDADETAAVKDSWKVDYGKVTPLLVKSIQDQQAIINAQQAEINELKAAVKQLLEKK